MMVSRVFVWPIRLTFFWVFAFSIVTLHAQHVDYRVTFDATWSRETHPLRFPPSPHFSNLVGGTHNSSVKFWEVGQTASRGIEAMAEVGATGGLLQEIQTAIQAGNAEFSFSGPILNPSPGQVSMEFQASKEFPLITLVTMIAPSPDWFVGTESLSLLDETGNWIRNHTFELIPYDSGTDAGDDYTSPNHNILPEPIRLLDSFPPLEENLVLGTYTFELISVDPFDEIEALSAAIRTGSDPPDLDINGDGSVNADDRIHWVKENQNTYFGDANLDGEFNSSDFVRVFEKGEYEDDIPLNSRWEEGDWNGDADFTSTDFIVAFQDGGYERGPLEGSASVPEPSGIPLVASGLMLLVASARRNFA